ncbi:MAG: HAD family hydrolase [Planctomycetes bacterium]|nr:HAD family hydrolase [Planctomycetota bacterium]
MIRRAVFLDRDGVINVSPPKGEYVQEWAGFTFLESSFDWVRLFNALDLLVIVVTNQRGVALGRMTQADVDDIHQQMLEEFSLRGCRVDDVFVCPHEEGTCECRKPRPGMVLAAQKKWNLDLAGSLMIGDSDSDFELARTCGLRFLRAENGRLVQG